MHSNQKLIKNNLVNFRRTNFVACPLQLYFRRHRVVTFSEPDVKYMRSIKVGRLTSYKAVTSVCLKGSLRFVRSETATFGVARVFPKGVHVRAHHLLWKARTRNTFFVHVRATVRARTCNRRGRDATHNTKGDTRTEHGRILQTFSEKKSSMPCKYKTPLFKKICTRQQTTAPSAKPLLVSISGGQDSSFLLFCLSFLQAQLAFTCNIIWCNHFWQIDSFYTTLHLTKSARGFSSPIIGFLPFQTSSSQLFYKTVATRYKKNVNLTPFLRDAYKSVSGSQARYAPGTPRATPLVLRSPSCFPRSRSCAYDRRRRNVLVNFQRGEREMKRTYGAYAAYKAPLCTRVATLCSSFFCLHKKKRSKSNAFYEKFILQTKQSFIHMRHNVNLIKPKAYKKVIKKISETQARNWRHIATERGCTFYDSNRCVYGHTLSDRVETILFNLVRGTGSKGVQSLPYKRRHSTFCYNKFYPTLNQIKKNTHIELV